MENSWWQQAAAAISGNPNDDQVTSRPRPEKKKNTHGNPGSSGDGGFHPAPCISSEASWTRNRPPTCPYTWRIDSMEPLQGGLGWSKTQKVITNKRKASYQTLQGHKNSYPSKKNMKEHSVVNIWYWTSKKWRVANSSGFFSFCHGVGHGSSTQTVKTCVCFTVLYLSLNTICNQNFSYPRAPWA